MKDTYTIIDLPKVPESFLLTEEEIRELHCTHSQILLGYSSWQPNNEAEMIAYYSKYFDSDISIRYQIITKDLPSHQDACKQDWKMNYVYKTGGDAVITSWEQTDLHCDPHVWYKLNVRQAHRVSGVESTRLSITLKLL